MNAKLAANLCLGFAIVPLLAAASLAGLGCGLAMYKANTTEVTSNRAMLVGGAVAIPICVALIYAAKKKKIDLNSMPMMLITGGIPTLCLQMVVALLKKSDEIRASNSLVQKTAWAGLALILCGIVLLPIGYIQASRRGLPDQEQIFWYAVILVGVCLPVSGAF